MKILSIYKKEEWAADKIRENIAALFGNDETECVVECDGMDMQPMIVKRADIYDDNGIAEIAEEDLHF